GFGFGEEILGRFVVLLNREMVAGAADSEDEIRQLTVTACIAVEEFSVDRDVCVFCERGSRRKFVVGCVAFPLDGREGVLENCFEKIFKDAFAVAVVGEDDDSGLGFFEADDIVPPAVVMTFLEEGSSVWRGVKAPAEAVAEID